MYATIKESLEQLMHGEEIYLEQFVSRYAETLRPFLLSFLFLFQTRLFTKIYLFY